MCVLLAEWYGADSARLRGRLDADVGSFSSNAGVVEQLLVRVCVWRGLAVGVGRSDKAWRNGVAEGAVLEGPRCLSRCTREAVVDALCQRAGDVAASIHGGGGVGDQEDAVRVSSVLSCKGGCDLPAVHHLDTWDGNETAHWNRLSLLGSECDVMIGCPVAEKADI